MSDDAPAQATLEDVVLPGGIQTGPFGSQLKASEYRGTGVPVVMPQDIRAGEIRADSIARVSEAKAKVMSRHTLREGDLVFARRGDLSKVAVVESGQVGWLCGTGCLRARLDARLANPRFIAQYVKLPRVAHWLDSNALGQTMLNLNTKIIGELPIVLPPLRAQERVADVLATWDDVIDKTERLLQAKRVEMVGIIVATAANSAGGRTRLGDICVVSKGRGLSKDDLKPSGAHPCILYGELHTIYGEVVTEVRSRTDILTPTSSLRGDVLIPSSSETSEDLANASALNEDDVLLGGDINILRPRQSGKYDAEYLAYYLTHGKRREIARLAQGNSIVHLYGRDIARLEVTLPSIEQQVRIASALEFGRREIAVLERIRARYLVQRRGVAQVLFGPAGASIPGGLSEHAS